jgi:N-acyl homoserine lactone hydrolase
MDPSATDGNAKDRHTRPEMAIWTIRRFVTGDYLSPPGGRNPGQRIMAVAYLIRHPQATVLFDTGFPFDAPTSVNEGEDKLWTYPRPLEQLLAAEAVGMDDLDLVVNCHLHIDHAGGNIRLPPALPIYAQEAELATARAEDEPLVRDALALERQAYRSINGEVELLPGIRALPTPGHTSGHQALAVETADGTVVLAGQAVSGATDFATAVYANELAGEGSAPMPPYPAWLPRLLALEPARVMFAHDLAIWEPERR